MKANPKKTRLLVASLTLFVLLCCSSLAQAQATRTWVSGVGDDANPCSRTAPCKTFAGAISKTAPGGEIDVLDPGGFGAVTITKSISIEADGVIAGVLVSGTNGIVVNAGSTDVVVIRGLTIEGIETGLTGIDFLAGGALHVENCEINGFTQRGIDFFPTGTGASQLFVKDTKIHDNTGGGIWVKPGAGMTAKASIDHVRVEGNLFGIKSEQFSSVAIRDSVAASNTNSGFIANSGGSAVDVTIESSISMGNGQNGVVAAGANATARISNATITNNGTGVLSQSSGAVVSFGNNRIRGNTTDGAPTSTVGQQ
jgi:hypothetical protein